MLFLHVSPAPKSRNRSPGLPKLPECQWNLKNAERGKEEASCYYWYMRSTQLPALGVRAMLQAGRWKIPDTTRPSRYLKETWTSSKIYLGTVTASSIVVRPNCPSLPAPQEKSCPWSLSATLWDSPQATWTMCCPARAPICSEKKEKKKRKNWSQDWSHSYMQTSGLDKPVGKAIQKVCWCSI